MRLFRELDLPSSAVCRARERNFEIAGYAILAAPESVRAPRVVRVGLIQNKIVLPTSDPVLKQVILFLNLQFYSRPFSFVDVYCQF